MKMFHNKEVSFINLVGRAKMIGNITLKLHGGCTRITQFTLLINLRPLHFYKDGLK